MVVKCREFLIRNHLVVFTLLPVPFSEFGILLVDSLILLFDSLTDRISLCRPVDWPAVVCAGNQYPGSF